jgi:hypothetical protein
MPTDAARSGWWPREPVPDARGGDRVVGRRREVRLAVAADLRDAGVAVIGLVACSAQKLDRSAPARELYCSPLFRKSLAYAAARCSKVYVLSARHHLVELDTMLEPYEHRLGTAEQREQWGDAVARELVKRHGGDVAALLLAGADYVDPIRLGFLVTPGARELYTVEPLARMQVGERLRWLNEQLAGKAA